MEITTFTTARRAPVKASRSLDLKTAEKVAHHHNEAARNPMLNRKIGVAYLSAADPKLATRIWQDVRPLLERAILRACLNNPWEQA